MTMEIALGPLGRPLPPVRLPATDVGEVDLADPKGRMIANLRGVIRNTFDEILRRGGHSAEVARYLADIRDTGG